jgi:hypothetical protein
VPIAIDPPQRVPRSRATALTTYFDLDAIQTGDPNPNRWTFSGVNFVSVGCAVVELQKTTADPCAAPVLEDSTPPGLPDSVTFPPFMFHTVVAWPANCVVYEDVEKHVNEAVAAELSTIFGAQVMQGTWNPAAPTLVSEAIDVTQTNVDSALEAVAAVEDGLADVWRDAVGMIHVTPGTLFEIAPHLEFVENRFYTPTGHIVVADAGYSGISPASGAASSGAVWVYGSSPVHYKYLTPDWSGQMWENFNYRRDQFLVRVDGLGIAVFEPCSVVAAKGNLGAVSGAGG